jgi:protein-S-isoprenylcysteine O-methyltransferase Ste14
VVENRQSRLGVGLKIALSAAVYAALAGAATRRWPGLFLLHSVPWPALLIAGSLLLLLGIALLASAIVFMMRGHSRDELVTWGPFSLCRHPLYAAWIVLILPGLALLTRSWPLLIMPLVAYAAFRLVIREEDDYLRRRYGAAYLEYRARVNELLPIPRL